MPSEIMQAVLSGDNDRLQILLEDPTLKIEDLEKEEKNGDTAFDKALLMKNSRAQDLITNALLRFKRKKVQEELSILEKEHAVLLRESFYERPDLFLNELNKIVEKQESEKIRQLSKYEIFKHLEFILAIIDEKKSEHSKKWPEVFDSLLKYGSDDVYVAVLIIAIQQNKYAFIKSLTYPICDVLYQGRRLLDWAKEQKAPEIYDYLYAQSQNPEYIFNRIQDYLAVSYNIPRYKYSDEDLQRFGHIPELVKKFFELVLTDFKKDSHSFLLENALDPKSSLGKVFFVDEYCARSLLKELIKAGHSSQAIRHCIMDHLIKDNYDIELISFLYSFLGPNIICYINHELVDKFVFGEGALPKIVQVFPAIVGEILPNILSFFYGRNIEEIYNSIERYHDAVLEILGKQGTVKEDILKHISTHPSLSIEEKHTVLSTIFKDVVQADEKGEKPTKALTKLFLAKRGNKLPNYRKGIFKEIDKTIAQLGDQIKKKQAEEEKINAFIKKKEDEKNIPYRSTTTISMFKPDDRKPALPVKKELLPKGEELRRFLYNPNSDAF